MTDDALIAASVPTLLAAGLAAWQALSGRERRRTEKQIDALERTTSAHGERLTKVETELTGTNKGVASLVDEVAEIRDKMARKDDLALVQESILQVLRETVLQPRRR